MDMLKQHENVTKKKREKQKKKVTLPWSCNIKIQNSSLTGL